MTNISNFSRHFFTQFDYFAPMLQILTYSAWYKLIKAFWSLRSTALHNFTPMHKQLRIWQIFSNFLRFLHQFWLLCPKMSNLGYIMPNIVAYILNNVMDYPCAKFYTNWSSNIHTTDIFQFLAVFAQNLAILPQKLEVPCFSEVYQTFFAILKHHRNQSQ